MEEGDRKGNVRMICKKDCPDISGFDNVRWP